MNIFTLVEAAVHKTSTYSMRCSGYKRIDFFIIIHLQTLVLSHHCYGHILRRGGREGGREGGRGGGREGGILITCNSTAVAYNYIENSANLQGWNV